MIETTSDAVLARLEALMARLDEQGVRLDEQAARIVDLEAENARLRGPAGGPCRRGRARYAQEPTRSPEGGLGCRRCRRAFALIQDHQRGGGRRERHAHWNIDRQLWGAGRARLHRTDRAHLW